MPEAISPESPLIQFFAARRGTPRLEPAGVGLCERPFLGHINLRGDPAEEVFLEATGLPAILGVHLPLEPNIVAIGPQVTVLWLGRDEWLLQTLPGCEAGLAERVRDALTGVWNAVSDVTSGYTVIRLWGTNARDVLAKGCPLDVHPRVFRPGQCAQTRIAKAGVILRPFDESPSFDLIVRRSFAEYLATWLVDAGQEYGVAVIEEAAQGASRLIRTIEHGDSVHVFAKRAVGVAHPSRVQAAETPASGMPAQSGQQRSSR